MWEIYDALIEGIPSDITIEDYCGEHYWCSVKTEKALGIAMFLHQASRPKTHLEPFYGKTLKEIAQCIKSWRFDEASLGLAAINAWYNSPLHTQKLDLIKGNEHTERDAFITYQQAITNKKVAVIGHFPYLEKRFEPICSLSILERAPKEGDYPDSACEYLLPEQDYVFITGVTFINKTLPRLLELSRQAKVILVGPSVPLAPVLFDFGISSLESFIVDNPQKCIEAIRKDARLQLFDYGTMVSLPNKSLL